EEDVQKVLRRDYADYKIHVADDTMYPNRFLLYSSYFAIFGLDKGITQEAMERQIKDNYLVALARLRDWATVDIIHILKGVGKYGDIAKLVKEEGNEGQG
ncbi:MAG: hypothetical protein ACYS8Z_15350, partial [Planctomycetota bacterium]